jgi:hypothetical protein
MDNPPPMRLTERDKAVIECVYRYRVLMQSQIEQLLFTGRHRSIAQERLSLLYHHGYLERQFLPVRGGMMYSPILYLLDRRGAELLTREYGYDEVAWKREHNEVGIDFLEHSLAINQFRILVTLACHTHHYPILSWHGESDLKADYDFVTLRETGGKSRRVSVIPDSAFIIDTPRQSEKTKAYFFLELDRGTMTTKRFKTKIEAYLAYIDGGGYEKRYGTKGLRVLTVTESAARLENLRRVTEDAGGKSRFWFATLPQLRVENVLSQPIWQVAGREGLSTLIEL